MHQSFIVPVATGQSTASHSHADFCRHQSEALQAFLRWAQTHPNPQDVEAEVNSAIGAYWGIAATIAAERRLSA